MPYFDRFDICEAHYLLERHYHVGGILHERPSNERRYMSTDYQLHRMGFRPGLCLRQYDEPENALTENGAEIYYELVRRYDLPID